MKRVDLPVSELSLAQKLDLMETLWADLTMRAFLKTVRKPLRLAK
jgi:hypothetical protein